MKNFKSLEYLELSEIYFLLKTQKDFIYNHGGCLFRRKSEE